MEFYQKISSARERAESFAASGFGKLILKLIQWLFLIAILAWLGISLYHIGWEAVWQNLPVHPLFYVFFLLMFFSAPVIQMIIYRLTWNFDIWEHISVFIKKRILNTEVVGYSGEVYFFAWVRNHIGLPAIKAGEIIRDYNLLSAFSTNSLTVIFLFGYLYFGEAEITDLIGSPSPIYAGAAVMLLIIIVPLAVRFRRYIFVTSLKMSMTVFGLYFLRLTVALMLQIAMWDVAIPEVPLTTWITFTVVSVLISRIPVTNKKLIFVGVGVGLSESLGVPEAAMFGLLIAVAALEKIMAFSLYLYFTLRPFPGIVSAKAVNG